MDRPAADSSYLSADFLTILLAVATTARTRPGLGITGTSGRASERRPAHPDFVRFVNAVLARWRADGGWAASYARWIGAPVPPPPPLRYAD